MFADLWRPPVQQVSLCSIRTTDSSRRTRLCMMGTRLKVLRVFKDLHKTRRDVFRDDDRALTAARLKINEEFKKNKNETSEENIKEMLKMARAVETILRENVVQGEHVEENKILLRPRKSLLLDNVPYSDTPRNKT
ncbi:complex III assembly factor LYRM7 [Labeo rohita]|uniref:complex III assembly factor LYRM7 n=1 Tax=Labeo rohita TaxID=84645 RepID=UPI0021E2FFE7|nr:complex III assembly factor LYRM7 [Labeo rohita]